MFKKKNNLQTIVALICMSSPFGSYAVGTPNKPNIVTIMVDDMGFSDLGKFGSEIETPNLDRMVDKGTQLTNYYSAPTSTPARAMFFTGRDNHPAGVGNMDGYSIDRPPQKNQPGYEGKLTKNLPTFAELLQGNGYHTVMTGKWDLGDKPGENASDRGFTDSLVLLPGGDVQFLSDASGKLITSQPPSYYTALGVATPYTKNGQPFSAFPPNAFSTDFYTDEAIKMLDNRADKSKPFYLNIAHIAPHGPFQAPEELINKYLPLYSQGWDKLREARFAKLKSLGLVKSDAILPPIDKTVMPWNSLTANQQKVEARRMATYAGLVEKLDQSVGKLVQHLKDTGEYTNTVFFVMSDNGAASIESGSPAKQAYINAIFSKDTFEKLSDIGGPKSFIPPSPGLGLLNNTPLNRFKADTFEGGIHTAALVFSPLAAPESKGSKYSCLSSVMDIPATILDITKTVYPTSYKGKSIKPMDGIPMTNVFSGNLNCPDPDRVLGFEQDSAKMVRYGDWKLAQKWDDDRNRWDEHLYLFNLAVDPFEQQDFSKTRTSEYSAMISLYNQYAKDNSVIDVGSRIFSSIGNLQLNPALPGAMILGGSQVNYGTLQHFPIIPQVSPVVNAAKVGDIVDIAAEIYPPANVSQALMNTGYALVAVYHKESGQWSAFQRKGDTSSLVPLPNEHSNGVLQAPNFNNIPKFLAPLDNINYFSTRLELPIYEGKTDLVPVGNYYFWVGYNLSNGYSVTSAKPITIQLAPKS